MSDIAKLFVETTARLMASPVTMESGFPGLAAFEQARDIVAEFYGEPCDGKDAAWYAPAPWREAKVEEVATERGDHQRPGDECGICGWPRGEHGRTK
jgi:hypothetical protein